ncbi:sterol desaturase family protein [Legionella sp. CNM-1927-20]|uniref:sterol desaturase family protein n=1 Tax=Legionella sp. CNM-1927-20 TaxID=3422221 RepID=UPI00403A9EC3
MDFYDADFYSIIRALIFFMMIGLFIVLEAFYSFHSLGKEGRKKRRLLNWSLGLITLITILPLSTLYAALLCDNYNIGLFQFFNAPIWLVFLVWFLINDFIYYSYHRLSHAYSFLWYFHKIHHSDKSINATTALRIHPIEYFMFNIYKISMIVVFGPYFLVVLVYDIVNSIILIWSHSNLKCNEKIERWLSAFIVTTKTHLLHHVMDKDTRNYGLITPLWDRLLGTGCKPLFDEKEINKLELGLNTSKSYDSLTNMLILDRLMDAIKKINFTHFKYSLITFAIIMGFWGLALLYPAVTQGLLGINFWWAVVYLALACHFTMIVISIYLHRSETHRAVKFHPAIRHIFRFWLWLATGTPRRDWVAVHRAHHQSTDTENDPHSPVVYGLKALFTSGFELYHKAKSNKEVAKYGIIGDNDYLERHWYGKYSIFGPIILLIIEMILFGVWAIPLWTLQMILQILFQASVINGLGHHLGYRNFETKDNSYNITRFGFFVAGEELHNNHHQYPASAKFSYYPNELDIGWIYILLLKKLGLAKIKLKPLAKAQLEIKNYQLKEE